MSGVTDKVESGEDALYLNVFAPATPTGATDPGKRPVMVWIHGGAFVMGSGSTPLYHGETFARQGVMVVTLNYRLGLPGFLYLGDLASDRGEGNYALLDQIAALGWVRDNIAAFGGDPDQVTVMGESAGAIAIATLLAMPAARGLFHRAILESGGLALSPPTRADATRVARVALAYLDVTVEQLADVPIDRLLACQEKLSSELGLGAFAPYIDGVTVPRPPIDVVREGGAAGIPLLAGSNRDEWTLFQVFLGDVTIAGFKAPLRDKLGPLLDRLVEVYQRAEPGRSEQRAWVDLVGELVFRIPVIRLAEAQSQAGAPVYLYRFDFRSPVFGGRLGAAHALELPFVWDRMDLPMATVLLGDAVAAAQPLATAMHQSWVRFIRTGDPNGGGLPDWPRYDTDSRPTLMLDRACAVAEDPAGEARAMWPAVWPA
ncbi:MAG: carboxylesterase/lipase family protein [Myxococcales bacterium]|nr:carboxylesterase/lipase family protein [Myxococcales bacterium]